MYLCIYVYNTHYSGMDFIIFVIDRIILLYYTYTVVYA